MVNRKEVLEINYLGPARCVKVSACHKPGDSYNFGRRRLILDWHTLTFMFTQCNVLPYIYIRVYDTHMQTCNNNKNEKVNN